MRTVDIVIGAVLQAGFEGAEAALVYRAVGDFALAWSGGEAGFLALDERSQAYDRAAWTHAYLAVTRRNTPISGRSGANCPMWTTTPSSRPSWRWSWASQAPRPCRCHPPAR